MAYVGTPIDTTNQFQSLVGKRFSGNGSTTAFTLDVAPTSTLDIEVFVENVRQDPNSAYSLSGTTLTLAAAPPSGTNNIYVVHQAKAVGTISPAAGTVNADSFDNTVISGHTALTSAPDDTDELLISDAGTIKRIDVSLIKAANTPAFAANLSSAFSVTEDSNAKIAFATEIFDTDSVYDASTNYRFTPGVVGKYYCYLRIGFSEHNTSAGSVSNEASIDARIYKNGSSICHSGNHSAVSSQQNVISVHTSVIADLDADDYIEAYAGLQNNDVNANLLSNAAYNEFGAFRIIT